tara:strand:- start:17970 stop:18824 length:855 start_codon:yes stop_codon:yes gene_type:complete
LSYQDHFKKTKAAKSQPVSLFKKSLSEEQVEAELRKAFGLKQTPEVRTKKNQKKIKVKKKSGKSFPIYPIASFAALMLGVMSYKIMPEPFEKVLSKVEFQWIGTADAKSKDSVEGKKSPSSEAKKEEKSAATDSHGKVEGGHSEAKDVSEDTSYLSKLKDRSAELDLREAELNQLEEELQRQRVEIENRIVELNKIRDEIGSKLEDRVQADEGKVKKLVELYSTMKPKQAAKIIESVNRDLAVEVLANMKKKSAADIMNVLDDKVAKELSERLTGYKRRPASSN